MENIGIALRPLDCRTLVLDYTEYTVNSALRAPSTVRDIPGAVNDLLFSTRYLAEKKNAGPWQTSRTWDPPTIDTLTADGVVADALDIKLTIHLVPHRKQIDTIFSCLSIWHSITVYHDTEFAGQLRKNTILPFFFNWRAVNTKQKTQKTT